MTLEELAVGALLALLVAVLYQPAGALGEWLADKIDPKGAHRRRRGR